MYDQGTCWREWKELFESRCNRPWKRVVFAAAWRITMLLAAIAVMVDHRDAMRDLGIGRKVIWRRWITCSFLAERFVMRPRADLVGVG